MRRFRVSIAGVMAVVASLAVIIAALRSGSRLWAGLLATALVAALGYAAIGALFARGGRRAFWSGFAAAGLACVATLDGPWLGENVGPRLAVDDLGHLLYAAVARPPASGPPPSVVVLRPVTVTEADGGGMHRRTILAAETLPDRGGSAAATAWDWLSRPTTQYDDASTSLSLMPAPFRRVVHALLGLACAALGGMAARRFAAMPAVDRDGAGAGG